ncbi:HPr family phosphocarrier protein [Alicyclobacillus fastidiosus]|uniref:Phosphocarrier protein HPr n=1 Tax=Alicyclobacillus fastidiosus TaxID=392011 RepID=A0ABV5AJY6_9BACL|nr:HPr family phosphocarrier protein [Alicyclobacillus fastidiosus]WEH11038.1 HPr family phosphocarrier protein [Alicyclobacillus fastidiosus]
MFRKKVTVHETSLTHQEASQIVREAHRFSSDIYIEKGNKTASAKSVLGLIALMISPGETVTVAASGTDAGLAVQSISTLLEK